MSKTASLDFKAVKAALDFPAVLSHYGLEMVGTEPQVRVKCPFHDDHKPTCNINTERNIFNCFACHSSGNILDFVVMMEQGDPDDKEDLIHGAQTALEIMRLDPEDFSFRKGKADRKKGNRKSKNKSSKKQEETPEPNKQEAPEEPPKNEPLPFTIELDPEHEFLVERGLDQETIETFGLGYCKKGIMAGRICIPIHDETGNLVAYAGRYAGDNPPDETPRYKLPKGFHKNLVLFNLHRIAQNAPKHVVLVEGFWSTIRLHNEGIPVVASFGDSLSDQQVELLVQLGIKAVTVLYDGDDGGRIGATSAVEKISQHLYVRKINLPDGVKPDTMSEDIFTRLR